MLRVRVVEREAVGEQSCPAECVESFDYPESPDTPFVPSWTGWEQAPDAAHNPACAADGHGEREKRSPAENAAAADSERCLAEEARRSFEAGRARGIEEGRAAERQARDRALAAEGREKILQAAALLEEFAAERERYFEVVEAEVVRLAIAVAARILRREAASDPLLLMGAVRAALGQIAGSTEVRLHVPAAELDLWTEAIALLPKLAAKPTVLAGEGMALGECRMETALGTADLGLRAQLVEVERAVLGETVRETVRTDRKANGRERTLAESAA